MNVLIGCEESQIVCKEFREAGHEAYSCDIEPCSGGHPEWHMQCDVREAIHSRKWDLGIFHPVCTRLTNAGRRWLHVPPKNRTMVSMWKEFFEGVDLYKVCQDAPIEMKCIENPIMHDHAKEMLTIGRRQIVQPWWFGDKAFKATGLELIGLPCLVPTGKLIPPKSGTQEHKEWSLIHRMSPGPDRSKLRSKTFPGIANAFASQWGCL